MPKTRKTPALAAAAAALLLAAFAVFAPHLSTLALWFLRGQVWWLAPLLALAAYAVFAFLRTSPDHGDYPSGRSVAGYVAVGLTGLLALIGWAFVHSYMVDKVYAQSIVVTSDPVPDFGERAPYQVAVAQATSNLGDVTGSVDDTNYLVSDDAYGTLVRRKGAFTGYETLLVQSLPLTGRGTATRCDFAPDADKRIGGLFGHKLERAVNKARRGVRVYETNAYGICDADGTPLVVMPLVEQNGLLRVTVVPAGVAIYDGTTGQIAFADTAPTGPAYPITVAADQREATHALGSFLDYFFKRTGWDTTEGTPDDPNAGNESEFVLPGDAPGYVTPLTPRGDANGINAIGVASTDAATGLAPLTVHRLDQPWKSTDAINKRIQGDYQDLPNYQNLRLFEIAPLDGKTWTATLGNDQNVLYRVTGTGTLDPLPGQESATCLHRADGSQIRCGGVTDRNGNGVGVQIGDGDGQSPAGVPTGDLAGLTDEQFAQLQRQVAEEQLRRLGQ